MNEFSSTTLSTHQLKKVATPDPEVAAARCNNETYISLSDNTTTTTTTTSFSVLISVYSREKASNLGLSLESVFEQTLPPTEVVLVEDGPLTPELYDVIEEYRKKHANLHSVKIEKNGGLGNALNEGLKHCHYELVARMDSDDICFPDRFERQVKFMTEHPDIDVCSGWMSEFEGEPTNRISTKKVPSTHEEISHYIKLRNPLNHPAVMFKKSAVDAAGGYIHFTLFEDWYLWVRMWQNGAKFANIPAYLLNFRTSADMFRRRGGFKYACLSAKFQWMLHDIKMLSWFEALRYSLMRGTVYIMPNWMRKLVYSKILRR